MYVYLYINTYIYIYMYICICISLYVYIYIYILCICIYIYIHIYIYIGVDFLLARFVLHCLTLWPHNDSYDCYIYDDFKYQQRMVIPAVALLPL